MSPSNNPFTNSPQSGIVKSYDAGLFDYLQHGNTINFIQAKAMGISQLDTRIAEIRKITNVYSRDVRINSLRYLEYSLQPFAK